MNNPDAMPIVVLVSGNGSNLQALIDARNAGVLPITIRAVISNESNAYALTRAHDAGVPTAVLSHRDFSERNAYDIELSKLIANYQPRLIVLAGFMRILSAELVNRFWGQMLNIHPALLPNFRGLHTHERALAVAVKEHGATVHFVSEELDSGAIIIQARVPILPGDTAAILASRVLSKEHLIYPLAVSWFAQGRLRLTKDHQVWLDDQLIPPQGIQYESLS